MDDILNEDIPCNGCIHVEKCEVQRLACYAFALYVSTGQVRWDVPRKATRRTYARIMWFDDASLTREINKYMKNRELV